MTDKKPDSKETKSIFDTKSNILEKGFSVNNEFKSKIENIDKIISLISKSYELIDLEYNPTSETLYSFKNMVGDHAGLFIGKFTDYTKTSAVIFFPNLENLDNYIFDLHQYTSKKLITEENSEERSIFVQILKQLDIELIKSKEGHKQVTRPVVYLDEINDESLNKIDFLLQVSKFKPKTKNSFIENFNQKYSSQTKI